jgi:hypothetical protein
MGWELYPQKWLRTTLRDFATTLRLPPVFLLADPKGSHVSGGSDLNLTNEGKILEPEAAGERECPVKVKRGGLNRYPAFSVHWTLSFR